MAEQARYKTTDEVDFLIIGSGAAGGVLAKELSTNGFRVVVLEQGPYLTEADFTHNEVEVVTRNQLTNHPELQPTTFRKTPQEKAKRHRALAGASPFDPPRSKPYPMPPLPVKSGGVIFERAARKLGWHPFPAPMAILSQPRPGRSACVQCGFCESFGCEVGAKSSTLATVIRMAEETGALVAWVKIQKRR